MVIILTKLNATGANAEHKIFLSPPDPECFPDGECGTIESPNYFSCVSGETGGDYHGREGLAAAGLLRQANGFFQRVIVIGAVGHLHTDIS